ncbi:MAG: hypothetical protein ACRC26_01735 [Bacteroidales bacterium]
MKNLTKSTIVLLIFFTAAYSTMNAQGVLFSEYRMLLKPKQVHTLQVCNPTDITRSFQLSLVDKVFDKNYKLIDITEPEQYPYSLKNNIRIFPRRITLEPGGCQEVQIQLAAKDGFSDGEYRSYLHFLPLESTGNKSNVVVEGDDKGTRFDIVVRLGAAIPLIYRSNSKLEDVSIDSVQFMRNTADGIPSDISFYVKRTGTQSIFGNLEVFLVGDDNEDIKIGESNGNAIYREATERRFILPVMADKLKNNKSQIYKIKIVYKNGESAKNTENLCEWVGTLK